MVEPISTVALGTLVATAIQKTTEILIDKISFQFTKEKFDIIKFSLAEGLPNYLLANYAKCQTLKTLLNRNDPVALEDCFVAPDFELQKTIISSHDFLNQISQSCRKIIVTGLAGSGKSVFLKYSFRKVIQDGYTYYPIFFELRSLNGIPPKTGFLTSAIFQSIKACCDSFTKTQFNYGLKTGAFYFLLDGFDELKHELREQVSAEIQELARNQHRCAIIVTSRPSSDFISWEGFAEAALLPFNLEKAVDYISKLRFDEEKKNDFLADLQDGLFEKNKEFLSNPLLSAMMLLTYDSFGEIPEKRHIFYSKCFDVLAREHDASKGRYKRELFSAIAMDRLEEVFMYFCAFSYVDRQFSFSEAEITRYVNDAVSSCGLEVDVDAVVRDFRESISIMELVGLSYEFAHRSFQEYFYAKFVITDRKLSLRQKIGWLCESVASDDTVEMIADMDKIYFEDEFLLPRAKELDDKLSKVDAEQNPAGILSKCFNIMHLGGRGRVSSGKEETRIYFTISNSGNSFVWHQAVVKYRDNILNDYEEFFKEDKTNREQEIKIFEEELGGEIKIHHTNNTKLKRVGAVRSAIQIKTAVFRLRTHLEEKQEKRKRGLGTLIRNKYIAR